MTWTDLYHFLRWMPPTADSAYFRAQKPNTWWVTPEMQVLSGILYAVEAANWQRGGCQGNAPKPIKFPTEVKEVSMSAEELTERRRRRRELGRG